MANMLACVRLSYKCAALPVFFARRLSVLTSKQCSLGFILPRDHITEFKRPLSVHEKSGISIDKHLLVKLRKETGFSFFKCKEALVLNNNSYSAAEAWLIEQAQKEGWVKATKLQGRTAAEGLIGIAVDNNVAAMVEVNCETDFVGRNDNFVDLVSMVTFSALEQRKAIMEQNQKINTLANSSVHLREVLLTHDMRDLLTPKGKVDDLVANMIGKLGENIKLERAITMTTEPTNVIGSHVHGSFVKHTEKVSLGKFGAVVALQPSHSITKDKLSKLSTNLAKHIVGMNPKVITHDGDDDVNTKSNDESEISDILQEQVYLLDNSRTVGDLLKEDNVQVVDFIRYECGEK